MKKLLIVVDYQVDFVSGSLGFPKAVELELPICEKIEDYRKNGDDVIFTFDTHEVDYLLTQEGIKLPVEHCIKGTPGWELYGKVSHYLNESTMKFEKNTFGSLELANYLQKKEYKTVELAGIVSNICVISNAVLAKAALPEAKIIIDALCTASHDDVLHEKTLDVMEGLQMEVINR
ncbi:MAG: cysteine hydrolase [Eubacteriaceae bacterium]|nr:cysteine hydrolase [Eubacteriaceae bacterium]